MPFPTLSRTGQARAIQQAASNTESQEAKVVRTYVDALGNVTAADIMVKGQVAPLIQVPNASGLKLYVGASVETRFVNGNKHFKQITGPSGISTTDAGNAQSAADSVLSGPPAVPSDLSTAPVLLQAASPGAPGGFVETPGANVVYTDTPASASSGGATAAQRIMDVKPLVVASLPVVPTTLRDGTQVCLVDSYGNSQGLWRLDGAAQAWKRVDAGGVALTNTTPSAETVGAAATVGTAATAARADHVHAMPGAFVASGAAHAAGFVPDPGATAGSTRYLREDGGWAAVPAGAAFLAPLPADSIQVQQNTAQSPNLVTAYAVNQATVPPATEGDSWEWQYSTNSGSAWSASVYVGDAFALAGGLAAGTVRFRARLNGQNGATTAWTSSGDVTYQALSAGSSLAVQSVDGSFSQTGITKLIFPNGTLTLNSAGVVTYNPVAKTGKQLYSSLKTTSSQYANLVYCWLLAEGSGNANELKTAATGTLGSSVTWIAGDEGPALRSNTTGANVTTNVNTFNTAAGSVVWRMRPQFAYNDGAQHHFWYLAVAGSANSQLVCEKFTDNSFYCGWYNGSTFGLVTPASATTLPQGTWNIYTLTWSSAGTSLYINNTLIGTSATAPSVAAPNGNMTILGGPANPSSDLDWWRFYNVALSTSQIAAIVSNMNDLYQ